MNTKTIARILNRAGRAGLATAALAATAFSYAAPATKTDKSTEESRVVVDVQDLRGRADINAEWVREDLLRSAFYDSASRAKWLGEYEFRYNANGVDNEKGVLELTVLDWQRSRAGMYTFAVRASYRDLDGKVTNLGVFHGYESGIAGFAGFDRGRYYVDSAEDAFTQALRKLNEHLG